MRYFILTLLLSFIFPSVLLTDEKPKGFIRQGTVDGKVSHKVWKILSNKLHDSVDDHFKLVSEEKYFRIRRDFSLRFMCLLTGSIRAISELRGSLRRQAKPSCKEIW